MYTIGTLQFDDPLHQLAQNILHVDMDAFYASLAERDDPSLKGKPVVMARHPKDTNGTGIVTTANYVARQYGIRSAMSSAEAYKRCPEAVFVPVNHAYIKTVSKQLYSIYLDYTSDVQRVAYDEAYLSLPIELNGYEVAEEIKSRIQKEVGLTCSVGVSYNKTMAKLASEFEKPNGLTQIKPDEAVLFLDNLPIEDFQGIGPKTASKLHALKVTTLSDLKKVPKESLKSIFGSSASRLLYRINGIDPRPVVTDRQAKSSGNERTFHPFLETNGDVRKALIQLIDKLGNTLSKDNMYGTTVVLKLRDAEFNNVSKRVSVNYLFNDKATLYDLVMKNWVDVRAKIMSPIRLVGITLTGLEQQENGTEGQIVLF